VLLDTLFRIPALAQLPLSSNWLGAIVLGLGVVYAVVKMQMAKMKKA